MTRDEFGKLLCRLCPNIKQALDNQSWPIICAAIAAELWRNRAMETEDTAELRKQLTSLADNGHFDFS